MSGEYDILAFADVTADIAFHLGQCNMLSKILTSSLRRAWLTTNVGCYVPRMAADINPICPGCLWKKASGSDFTWGGKTMCSIVVDALF